MQGTVLLDAAWHPRTVWRFEAVLVLFGGRWPPRGLLSGRWPPAGCGSRGGSPGASLYPDPGSTLGSSPGGAGRVPRIVAWGLAAAALAAAPAAATAVGPGAARARGRAAAGRAWGAARWAAGGQRQRQRQPGRQLGRRARARRAPARQARPRNISVSYYHTSKGDMRGSVCLLTACHAVSVIGVLHARPGTVGREGNSWPGVKQFHEPKDGRCSCHTCRVAYTPVVHCGSVRQTARVVSIQELPPPAPAAGGGCLVDGCDLACAITAAAALLGSAPDAPREGLPGPGPMEGACGDAASSALLGAGYDAAFVGPTGPGTQALYAGHGAAGGAPQASVGPKALTPSAAAVDSSKPPSAAVGIPGAPAVAPGAHSPRSPAAGGTWRGEPVRREGGGGDLGCTARVVLEFCHRPEWLRRARAWWCATARTAAPRARASSRAWLGAEQGQAWK